MTATSFHFDPSVSSVVPESRRVAKGKLPTGAPLSDSELALMQRYWQAANYLTIG
jgi:hypothetical protein